MPKFKVYVTETVRTYYKPVIVNALNADDAVTKAENIVAQGEIGEQDSDSVYASDAALLEQT